MQPASRIAGLSASSRPDARRGSWWRLAFGGLGLSCLAGLASPFLASVLAGSGGVAEWLIDLVAHWQWLFLLLLLLATAGACCSDRRWALLLLAAPLPWCSAWTLAPAAASAAPAVVARAQTLSIASANVFFRNRDAGPLLRWLDEKRPDLIVILEFTPAFADGLQALQGYPYREFLAQSDAFGIGILSRHPLAQVRVTRDDDGIPLVEMRVRWGDRTIGLAALHPMPPQTPRFHALRNGKLASLTPAAGPDTVPTIVAGDFNATPWSDAFDGLARRGWRRATGLGPTWPAAWRGWMGIPIDHVVVTRDWRVVRSEVGPNVGSDHFPVLVRLALESPATAADR